MDGLKIAISASEAPDSPQLGMPSREVDRALLTICTTLVRKGCEILYAGNLAPDQFTFKIFRHLAGAYAGARADAPFLHVIAEPIVRRTSFENMHGALDENGSIARTRISIGNTIIPARVSGKRLLLGSSRSDRTAIDNSQEWDAWLKSYKHMSAPEAYTAARKFITGEADARVAIGGKMGILANAADKYEGSMSGIVEEAIMSLESGHPFVPVGAYGGATRDVAIALGLLPAECAVPRGDQQPGYAEALSHVTALTSRIPETQKPLLSEIANDDRGEQASFMIAQAILAWRQKQ